MFTTNQNSKNNIQLNNARNEKNGEFFITEKEVERELRHYLGFLKGKKVYIPNTKMTTEIAKFDAFVRFFGSNTIIKKYELEELFYSYYDEEDNFVLVRVNDLGIIKTVIDAKDDDSRLFHVYKTIDTVDVVIGNPEGNKLNDMFRYIYLSGKDYIFCVSINHFTTKIGFSTYNDNKTFFGYNIPSKFYSVEKGKIVTQGNKVWITSFNTNITPNFIKTFWTIADGAKFDLYQKFDNYDVINVDCVKTIPMDYEGVMAVPVSILPSLNKEQFEVIGLLASGYDPKIVGIHKTWERKEARGVIDGKVVYARVLVRFRNI